MQQATQIDDNLLMNLMERALALPKDERHAFLLNECRGDAELLDQVRRYIQWGERMGGFLLDPIFVPPEDDCPFEPGQILIHRFKILREVAQGGMGVVWEAMDEKLDRRVAIKCAKAGFGKQLPPEVRNARDVSHPNVCKIYEIHTASTPQGEVDFISMEFIEGETLRERLQSSSLTRTERFSIARQLCAGVSEAHRNNIVHGDLKSNNVVVTGGPDASIRAVIMDFGLARRPNAGGPNPSNEALLGTPAYMAPELWKGVQPSVTSDIYALGVILWELASGCAATDLGVTSTTLAWDQRPAWKAPKGYGKWDSIVAGCLEADPAHRFQSADELVVALGPPPRRRWLLTASVAAVLAIVSGLITYQRATAPAETVRLALLPFSSGTADTDVSDKLFRDTANQLARVRGNRKTRFIFIPLDKILRERVDTPDKARTALGASYVLHGVLEQQPKRIKVRAYLTEMRSGVDGIEWDADYTPEQMRYVPVALTGVVTGMLHLPISEISTVNAAAKKDYLEGLSDVRRDSGVDTALEHFEKAVAADSDSPLTYAALAEAQWFKYYGSDDKIWLDRVTESVRRAESRNRDLPEVHRIAGLLKANGGWYEQAVTEYLRAIELEPGNGDAFRRLGEAYQSNNQLEQAKSAFLKAVEIDPNQYKNYRDLGYFYHERANYGEATRYFRQAVTLAPNEPLIHFSLSTALLNAGQFKPAENELRWSIRLQETSTALHELGLVLMLQGKDEEAIPSISRALELGPGQYLWWMNLGTAYRRVGLKSNSKNAYRRGFDLAEAEMMRNPRGGNVRANLAYLSAQLGDRRRAESEIAQALEQWPNDSDTRYMAALTYEALGRRDNTLAVLAASPTGVLQDVSRWPDLADLRKDSRFLQLLASHSGK